MHVMKPILYVNVYNGEAHLTHFTPMIESATISQAFSNSWLVTKGRWKMTSWTWVSWTLVKMTRNLTKDSSTLIASWEWTRTSIYNNPQMKYTLGATPWVLHKVLNTAVREFSTELVCSAGHYISHNQKSYFEALCVSSTLSACACGLNVVLALKA